MQREASPVEESIAPIAATAASEAIAPVLAFGGLSAELARVEALLRSSDDCADVTCAAVRQNRRCGRRSRRKDRSTVCRADERRKGEDETHHRHREDTTHGHHPLSLDQLSLVLPGPFAQVLASLTGGSIAPSDEECPLALRRRRRCRSSGGIARRGRGRLDHSAWPRSETRPWCSSLVGSD